MYLAQKFTIAMRYYNRKEMRMKRAECATWESEWQHLRPSWSRFFRKTSRVHNPQHVRLATAYKRKTERNNRHATCFFVWQRSSSQTAIDWFPNRTRNTAAECKILKLRSIAKTRRFIVTLCTSKQITLTLGRLWCDVKKKPVKKKQNGKLKEYRNSLWLT